MTSIQAASARKLDVRTTRGKNSGQAHRCSHGRANARSFHAFRDRSDAGPHARGFDHRAGVRAFVSIVIDSLPFAARFASVISPWTKVPAGMTMRSLTMIGKVVSR
jgi:hypothetical protein